jgi:predicted RNA-binding Zn-ribbon protein involved in translation (DUF1610 family)
MITTLNNAEQILLDNQNVGRCNSCSSVFTYTSYDTWFDENGYSYSTKLTKCPECGKIVILKYIEDSYFHRNFK